MIYPKSLLVQLTELQKKESWMHFTYLEREEEDN
jgi:hypothetical protein